MRRCQGSIGDFRAHVAGPAPGATPAPPGQWRGGHPGNDRGGGDRPWAGKRGEATACWRPLRVPDDPAGHGPQIRVQTAPGGDRGMTKR